MTLQRYTLDYDCLEKDKNGDYVLHADAVAEIERLQEQINAQGKFILGQTAKIGKRRAELAAKEAEIGRLKVTLRQVFADLKTYDGCVSYSVANKVEAALSTTPDAAKEGIRKSCPYGCSIPTCEGGCQDDLDDD